VGAWYIFILAASDGCAGEIGANRRKVQEPDIVFAFGKLIFPDKGDGHYRKEKATMEQQF